MLLALAAVTMTLRYYLLRYRQRKAEQLQRLESRRKEEVYESKMRFFSNITQELSMPLTMISGPCQQIITYRKSDSYILKYAQTIRQNVSKLHDLIYMLHEFRGIRTSQNDENENIELVPVAEIAQESRRPSANIPSRTASTASWTSSATWHGRATEKDFRRSSTHCCPTHSSTRPTTVR